MCFQFFYMQYCTITTIVEQVYSLFTIAQRICKHSDRDSDLERASQSVWGEEIYVAVYIYYARVKKEGANGEVKLK